MDEFISNLSKQINKAEIWYQFLIIEKSSQETVGVIGVHFVQSLFFKGNWIDDVIYAIFEREWIEKRNYNSGTIQWDIHLNLYLAFSSAQGCLPLLFEPFLFDLHPEDSDIY